MKISEIIERLETFKKIVGDEEVYFKNIDGEHYCSTTASLEEIDVGVDLSTREFLEYILRRNISDADKLEIIESTVDVGWNEKHNVIMGNNFKKVPLFELE